MTPSRPYLIRALYDWIVDNHCTPHILVETDRPRVKVPLGFAQDGQILLNIAPSAVRQLVLGLDQVVFEGRFGGVPHQICVPIEAILAIYARENGQGMVFEADQQYGDTVPTFSETLNTVVDGDEPPDDLPPDDSSGNTSGSPKNKPNRGSHLRVVK